MNAGGGYKRQQFQDFRGLYNFKEKPIAWHIVKVIQQPIDQCSKVKFKYLPSGECIIMIAQ
jgi:hypothetical protein